jgi:mRNA interferase MazF
MYLPNLMPPMPMAYKRGGIYLANFNPSRGTEPGKIRPCIVMQSNLLNDVEHPSTTILPLTTQLIEDAAPLRLRLCSRDRLEYDSDVMLDQTRTIDNRRISGDMLTILSEEEMRKIELYWRIVLDLE